MICAFISESFAVLVVNVATRLRGCFRTSWFNSINVLFFPLLILLFLQHNFYAFFRKEDVNRVKFCYLWVEMVLYSLLLFMVMELGKFICVR